MTPSSNARLRRSWVGGRTSPEELAEQLVAVVAAPRCRFGGRDPAASLRSPVLTRRELEVLAALTRGLEP